MDRTLDVGDLRARTAAIAEQLPELELRKAVTYIDARSGRRAGRAVGSGDMSCGRLGRGS